VGAFVVDGRLVDGPFITRAEHVVSLARRLGLIVPTQPNPQPVAAARWRMVDAAPLNFVRANP